MSEATSLANEYNKTINRYGGSILLFPAGSVTPNDWGDVSDSKYSGSSYFIGFIQEAKRVLNYQEFGKVRDDDCICFAKSGTSFNTGDKIVHQSVNYEVSSIHKKSVSDGLIYQKLLLTHL